MKPGEPVRQHQRVQCGYSGRGSAVVGYPGWWCAGMVRCLVVPRGMGPGASPPLNPHCNHNPVQWWLQCCTVVWSFSAKLSYFWSFSAKLSYFWSFLVISGHFCHFRHNRVISGHFRHNRVLYGHSWLQWWIPGYSGIHWWFPGYSGIH